MEIRLIDRRPQWHFNAANDPTAIETGPYTGSGCDIDLAWVHFKMNLSTNGMLNVWWKNFQVVSNLPTSFLPYPGRIPLSAPRGAGAAQRTSSWTTSAHTRRSDLRLPTNPPDAQHHSRTAGKQSSTTLAFCNRLRYRRVAILTCLTRAVHTLCTASAGN